MPSPSYYARPALLGAARGARAGRIDQKCRPVQHDRGIRESELVGGVECGGVGTFLADSLRSRTSLFT